MRPLENASPADISNAEKSWNRVIIGYWPYVAIGFLLAVSLPSVGLSSFVTGSVVDAITRIVPSIDRLARLSFAPEFSRAFGALMWLLQPIFTIVAIIRSPRVPLRVLRWTTLLALLAGVGALALTGFVIPFYFPGDLPEELSYTKGRGLAGLSFLLSSRIGHGTLGAVMFAFVSLSQVLLWRIVRDYPSLVAFNIRSRLERRRRYE
jgi:hypothetical protein